MTAFTSLALAARGFEVVRVCCMEIEVARNISAVPSGAIIEAATLADDPSADGMFISCRDFRATAVVEEIESGIGKPVVTSNQASMWQALRAGGCEKPLSGYGRL